MKIEAVLHEGDNRYERVVCVSDRGETAADFVDVVAAVAVALGFHHDSILEAMEQYLFDHGIIKPCGEDE